MVCAGELEGSGFKLARTPKGTAFGGIGRNVRRNAFLSAASGPKSACLVWNRLLDFSFALSEPCEMPQVSAASPVLAGWVLWWVTAAGLSAQEPLSEDRIQQAYSYSKQHNGAGLLVWEKGATRFEKYAPGHGAGEPMHIYSGTKSFFGVLAVVAEQEGIIDLKERVAETLPEWRLRRFKREVTVRELLNFTSGLETGFEEIYGGGEPNKLKAGVALPSKAKPGTTFIYGPSHLQVFGEVLRRKLAPRGLTYEAYLESRVLTPLGIDYSKWRRDGAGNLHLSAGMHLTARQWLKFGILVAQGGTWEGASLVKREQLAQCFEGTQINPAYGLTFWLNRYASNPAAEEVDVETWLAKKPLPENWHNACLSKAAPDELICCLGSNAQRLYVVPSRGLVVLHQGRPGKFRDAEFLRILFGPPV